MEFAVALAAKGKFTAKPNPVVGAILLKNEEIISHVVSLVEKKESEILNKK